MYLRSLQSHFEMNSTEIYLEHLRFSPPRLQFSAHIAWMEHTVGEQKYTARSGAGSWRFSVLGRILRLGNKTSSQLRTLESQQRPRSGFTTSLVPPAMP